MADTIVQKLPTGDISSTGWFRYPTTPTTFYDKVDDEVGAADDATTYGYVSSTSAGTYTLMFSFTAFDIPAAAKNISLKIVVRATRSSTLDPQIAGAIRIDTTNYAATAVSVTGSYADYTFTFATDPSTSAAWTYSGINGIDGFGCTGQRVGFVPADYNLVTQVYAEVSYNLKAPYASAGPGIVVGAESVSAG